MAPRRQKSDESPMPEWPAAHVEMRDIATLVPYARNARTHSDEQVAQLMASMREWGWTVPVLVDEEGTLIAGHGRVLAGTRLGYTQAPTMVARGWTPAQIAAYRIADNKLALNAGWDPDLLRIEIGDLKDFGFELDLTGFATHEVEELFHDWVGSDEEAVTRHGENLDGIEAKVTIRCAQDQREAVLDAVKEALKGWAGLTVE